MRFAFDLISDLHVDTWDTFDWTDQPTSTVCVVAGDVARDRNKVIETLTHLGRVYQAVFYIDGNSEHEDYLDNLDASYADLVESINAIPNVVFMLDNVVVMDGVAILATNGWWTYDFDLLVNPEQSIAFCQEKYHLTHQQAKRIGKAGTMDATYMVSSIRRLQTHMDVKKIVVVTHTVPDPQLIAHDIQLENTHKFNCMGNRYMMQAMAADISDKIHTWCFGHYHNNVDQIRSGIRFVNNCRGRGDTEHKNYVYYPKRIVVEF